MASIWRENMLGYLSLDIICSSKLTAFLELRSQKTVRGEISEHIFGPNGGYCLHKHDSTKQENCYILE